MKSTLLSFINTGIITILLHGSAEAQVALNKSVNNRNYSKTDNLNFPESKVAPAATINFRAVKDFNKRFAVINNAMWYATDKAYMADFSAGSIKATVAYGRNGNWLYTIQRYYEEKLAADIRTRVKSIYFDYTITCISEVHVPQQEHTAYILNLQHNQDFKTVRVCGDDMDVIAKYHSYSYN